MTHTSKRMCPKCGSDDCNLTTEQLGKLIVADVRKRTVYCNKCTYTKVSLIVHVSEICVESKEPGYEDTDLEYKYLGPTPG